MEKGNWIEDTEERVVKINEVVPQMSLTNMLGNSTFLGTEFGQILQTVLLFTAFWQYSSEKGWVIRNSKGANLEYSI